MPGSFKPDFRLFKLFKSSGLQAFYLQGKERGDQILKSAGFYRCVPRNRESFSTSLQMDLKHRLAGENTPWLYLRF